MSVGLQLLCRVIRRRMAQGETLDEILLDYPPVDQGRNDDCAGGLCQPVNGQHCYIIRQRIKDRRVRGQTNRLRWTRRLYYMWETTAGKAKK